MRLVLGQLCDGSRDATAGVTRRLQRYLETQRHVPGGDGLGDLPRRVADRPLLAAHAEVRRELEGAARRSGEPP
eukprot:42277-Pyramimonas_sp.AAC.1